MCGIVAMLSPREPLSVDALWRGTKALSHRGPDGQRVWTARDGRAGLGHARLSIIDLKTGDQPIASEDESLRIVVNGEFYGYEEIQEELRGSGHKLRTRADSEIALHLYEDLGAQAVHRLRGEFAIALWDEVNETLFAVRDRFGIKPLFYAFHEGVFYLASEVKALFAAGVPARWDPEGVYHALNLGWYETRTLFDGVFSVPPGHYLTVTDRHFQLTRYWDFDYPRAGTLPPRSDEDYAEELRLALDEAVRIRLRADVPVGCYLSGGLDSCSVLGLAAKHRSDPIRAFTVAFDRPDYDEEAIAKEMAQRVGAEFHPIPLRQEDFADHFADATFQAETLSTNAHGVAKFLLSRAAHKAGYKVVLTGEGSDEVLGGYAHFRRDMILYNAEGQDPELIATLRAELERIETFSRTLMPFEDTGELQFVRRLLGFVPSWIESYSVRSGKMRALLTTGFLEDFAGREGLRGFLSGIDVREQLQGREPVNQSLYLFSKSVLPSYILPVLGDRMEMAHAIEGRLPFLDHKVVEVLRTHPARQKVRGLAVKFVLREAAKSVITKTAYERHKHPFVSPPATLDPEGRLGVLMNDTLRGSALASIPFFDKAKATALLDSVGSMDQGSRIVNDQVLMMLLSACVLQERFRLTA
jgi:asparagine synthase (glutamine-hydrolysing)